MECHTRRCSFAGLPVAALALAGPAIAQVVAATALNEHAYTDIVAALNAPIAEELNRDIRIPGPVQLTSGSWPG